MAEQPRQEDSESRPGLTVFEPYDDKPKGAFAKIASFFNSLTQAANPPSKLSTHTLKMSDVQKRAESDGVPSGQESVGSLRHAEIHGDTKFGVPPDALDKALRNMLKEGENRDGPLKSRDFKRYWMPDSAVKECFKCSVKFTVTLRRHHCRLCGQIFCNMCCSESVPGKIVNQPGSVRACVSCARLYYMTKQQNSVTQDESMVVRALREESEIEEMVVPVSDELNVVVSPPIPVLASQSSVTRTRTSSMLPWDTSPTNSSSNLVPMNSLPSDASLLGGVRSEKEAKALAIDRLGIQDIFLTLMSPGEGLPLEPHRKWLKTYHNSFQANEIVTWLIDKGFAATRFQAVELGQAMVHTKMLEVVTSFEQEFKDDSNAILIPLQLQQPTGGGGEEGAGMEDSWHLYWRHSGNKYAGSSPEGHPNTTGTSAATPPSGRGGMRVPYNTPRTTLTGASPRIRKPSLPTQQDYCIVEKMEPRDDPEPLSPSSDWEARGRRVLLDLERSAEAHWEFFLRQLLHQEGLDQAWYDIIKPLAVEASNTVQPYSFAQGQMDILHYIKFKKVPGGKKVDCTLYYGEVFTKTVPYKHMLTKIDSPSIMLFKCPLEVHRSHDKLTSMESLILQEEEYMRNWVDRIRSFQPDIIVIEESITGVALNMLLEAGITVITNVKESVMHRLAHCTEAELIESIKGISLGVKCGYCKQFYVKTYTLPNGKQKYLMFFDECKHSNACSIVLRGGSLSELRRVKRVFRFAIFAAYSNILECRYLWNEFAQPVPLQASMYQALKDELDRKPQENEDNVDALVLYPCAPVYSTSESLCVSPSDLTDGLGLSKSKSSKLEGSLDLTLPKAVESSLFPDPQTPRDSIIFMPHESSDSSSNCASPPVTKTSQHVFLETLVKSLITFSPGIAFTIPYVIQNGVDHGHIMKYLKGKYFWSHKFPFQSSQPESVSTKGQPSLFPGKYVGEPLTLQASVHSFSPLHMTNGGLSTDPDSTAHDQRSLSIRSQRPSYVSVTSHPFLSTILSSSAKSKEFKAMLADFRARAGLEGESQEFFFPSIIDYHQDLAMNSSSSPGCKPNPSAHSLPAEGPAQPSSQSSQKKKPRRCPVKRKLKKGRDYAEENLHYVRNAFRRLPAVIQDSTVVHASPLSGIDLTELTEDNAVCGLGVGNKLDCMDPYNHQNIALHYSTTCPDSPHHPRFCTAPRNLILYYYSQNDITLGDFLYRFCFSDAACSVCKLSFQSHQLHIAHGMFVINISMEKREMAPTTDIELIYTWHKCKECGQITPSNMLSSPALALSFGKLLELKFYAGSYIPRSTGAAIGDQGPVSSCVHSLHHSHVQFFGYQNYQAEFDLCPVSVFEVHIPPMKVKVVKGHIWDGLNWEMDVGSISGRIKTLFEAVKDRLEEFNVEPHKSQVNTLIMTCDSEHAGLCRKLAEMQNLIAAGGLSKSFITAQDHLEEAEVASYVAQLQDGTVELKKKILRSASHWNKICEKLHASIVDTIHSKSFQKLSKSTIDLQSEGTIPQESDVTYSEVSTVGSNDAIDLDKCLTVGESESIVTTDKPVDGGVGSPGQVGQQSSPPDRVQATVDIGSPTSVSKMAASTGDENMPVRSTSEVALPQHGSPESRTVPGRAHTISHNPKAVADTEVGLLKALSKKDRGKTHMKSDISFDETHFGPKHMKKEKVLERSTFFGKQKYQPIPSPFPPSEHYLLEMELEIPVGVFESEPSSIIACALSCKKYRTELELRRHFRFQGEQEMKSQVASEQNTPFPHYSDLTEVVDIAIDGSSPKSSLSPHIQLEFGNSYISFVCKVFFAEQFESLRQLIYTPGEERYIRSLLRCVHWRARGGKSGSAFCKVVDDRFVLKQIKKAEAASFCEIGHDYLQYIESAFNEKRPTCLAKILGVYHVKFSNSRTSQSMEGTFLVMENLRYAHPCNHVFDLKGSMRNRFVRMDDSDLENVYQDENFLQYIQTAPLYIHGHSKKILMEALKTDTEFLAEKNVMDYSLLAGVSESSQLIVVGIIDYLRAFTWDKKLEAWIKRDLLVAGSKGQLPTIVSPNLYRRRFIEAMEQYFALIPDKWYNLYD